MQQYQERLEKAALESRLVGNRPKTEGGWEEVQPQGGWADAGVVPGTSDMTSNPPIKQVHASTTSSCLSQPVQECSLTAQCFAQEAAVNGGGFMPGAEKTGMILCICSIYKSIHE